VTLTAPAQGATVSGTVTMTATASDNVGVSRVEFKVDGVLKCSDTTSPYSCSWDTTTSTNGSHNASATAFDAAGNSATDTNGVTVSNSDTTAPTVTLTYPAEGATVSGTITMTATASDNVGVAYVEFRVDGVVKCTDTSSPYSCSWDTTTSTNGSHAAAARAYDAAGNTSVDQNNVTVTSSDTTAPTVTLTAPAQGATVSGTVTMTATASDAVGVTRVEFKVDGVLKCSDTTSPYSCSWNTTTSSNGAHSASATAFDAAGNNATDSNSVTVNNIGDSVSPVPSFVSPANGATVSGQVTVTVSATDNVAVTQTELYLDGVLKSSSTNGSLTYRWNTRKESNGAHSLTAKAYDAAGNVGTTSISVTVQ